MSDVQPQPGAAPEPAPIVINPSAVPDITESQIGPFVGAVSGVILAFGLLSPSRVDALAALAPYIIVSLWRAYRAWRSHGQKVVMANAAPNAIRL